MRSTHIILSIVLLVAILVSGCSASTSKNFASNSDTPSTQIAETDIPSSAKLIAGTLKLTETKGTFTADEAKQLIFLWEAYKELQTRDTAAQQEKDALITQIEGTLTDKQKVSLNSLNLSAQEILSLVRENGTNSDNNTKTNTVQVPGNTQGGNFIVGAGGPPAGGPPADFGGGGGFGGNGTLTTEQRATLQAARSTGVDLSKVALNLLDPLIEALKTIADG